MVVRGRSVVARSRPLQHFFDCPLQLGAYPEFVDATDTAAQAEVFEVPLQAGDVVIAGARAGAGAGPGRQGRGWRHGRTGLAAAHSFYAGSGSTGQAGCTGGGPSPAIPARRSPPRASSHPSPPPPRVRVRLLPRGRERRALGQHL
jgi:hypothetical protein